MSNCPRCNKTIQPADAFCAACGAPLAAAGPRAVRRPDTPLHESVRAHLSLAHAFQWASFMLLVLLAFLGFFWGVSFAEGFYVDAEEVWIGFVAGGLAVAAVFAARRIARIRQSLQVGDPSGAVSLATTPWIVLSLLSGTVISGVFLALARHGLQEKAAPALLPWGRLVPQPLRRPALAGLIAAGILLVVVVAMGLGTGSGGKLEWYEDQAVGTWTYYHSPDDSRAYLVLKPNRTGCHLDSWRGGINEYEIRHWRIEETQTASGASKYTLWTNKSQVEWGTFHPHEGQFRASGSLAYNPAGSIRDCR